MDAYQILLTNDDGINSPGLWAAAEALSALGFVHVAAPREQYSGAGRSMPSTSDGKIETQWVTVHGKEWTVYAVGGSPAQTVEHAMLEILPRLPDLVVSGINFGENIGIGVTASGTVGAAMEAAVFKIPALAVSLETPPEYYLSHSDDIDFSVAAYFTAMFARKILQGMLPEGMDVLNLNVPAGANIHTPWKVTCLSREPYYELTAPERQSWAEPAKVRYRPMENAKHLPGTDCYAIRSERLVSVSPLSIDMTAHSALGSLDAFLRA